MTNEKDKADGADPQLEIGRALRNFRNIPDIEHFYRFVYDNNLRREAKIVFEVVTSAVAAQKKLAKKKASPKKQKS